MTLEEMRALRGQLSALQENTARVFDRLEGVEQHVCTRLDRMEGERKADADRALKEWKALRREMTGRLAALETQTRETLDVVRALARLHMQSTHVEGAVELSSLLEPERDAAAR
jgi:hypothetical protein